jgi:hypothetical protein
MLHALAGIFFAFPDDEARGWSIHLLLIILGMAQLPDLQE